MGIAKLFSINQVAIKNDIDAENYLNYIFANINKESIDNLLPYFTNIKEK